MIVELVLGILGTLAALAAAALPIGLFFFLIVLGFDDLERT